MNNEKENIIIEDTDLDRHFEISAEHRHIAVEIEKMVMHDIRHNERKRLLAKWGRPVIVAFGLPLVIMIFAILLHAGCQAVDISQWKYVLAFPIVALLASAFYQLTDFELVKGQ